MPYPIGAESGAQPERDQVAREVAERFKLIRECDSWYFDCPVFDKHIYQDGLIDALIDSTLECRRLREALEKLANESSGFLSMATIEEHGATNIKVLHDRILEARVALKAGG